MSSWDREVDLTFRGWTVAAALVAVALIAWVVLLGTRAREEPPLCRDGLQLIEARCCAPGQGASRGQCVGAPDSCPAPFTLATKPTAGCVMPNQKLRIQGGSVTLGPTDWDSVDVVEGKILHVHSFLMDSLEVSVHRYLECEESGLCETRQHTPEPGLPVTGLTAAEADTFCAFAGGRLPTPYERIFAATGQEARRYPWGPHGLVCRRAVFGLQKGPCAEGALLPELVGMRPDGASPEGLLDLSGNVAEWAKTESGELSVHGGSFRSQQAGQLKSWSTRPATPADDIGFRCVYPTREDGKL